MDVNDRQIELQLNPTLSFSDDKKFGIMMAHYVSFVSTVIHCLFFSIASCFARWVEMKCSGQVSHVSEVNRHLILSTYLHLQFPVLFWMTIKYEVHFGFNLLISAISNSTDQISYFYNLGKPDPGKCGQGKPGQLDS